MLNDLAIFNGVVTILLAKPVLLALPMDAILPLVLAAVLSAIIAPLAAANWALPRTPARLVRCSSVIDAPAIPSGSP